MKTLLFALALSLSSFSPLGWCADGQGENRPDTEIGDAVSAFHAQIEPVWHRAYPARDAAAIRESVPALKHAAEGVLEATKDEDSSDSQAAAERLLQSVDALAAAFAAGENDGVFLAVEQMHDQFHVLMSTLDVDEHGQH